MITRFDKFFVSVIAAILYAVGQWGGFDVESFAPAVLQIAGAVGGPLGVILVANKS